MAIDRRPLTRGVSRALIVALLLFKALLPATAVADGWCVRFTSPVPLFVDNVTTPHAWDVRADWRSGTPQCSAIMTRGYASTEEFPVWFYNLPPANWEQPAEPHERPPHTTLALEVRGVLQVPGDGVFMVDAGEGVGLSAAIDGAEVDAGALSTGVALRAGIHEIALSGHLTGDRWRLRPLWNGDDVWRSATATMQPPGVADGWLRPWGARLQDVLVIALVASAWWPVLARLGDPTTIVVWLLFTSAALATAGRVALMRLLPVVLAAAASLTTPRRLRNIAGAQLLIGVPFLVMIAVYGAGQIGRMQWYSIGDDWWMFQRYAYRIYLQGYWLEGGEPVFWFQPFYRWIAGALHLIFGDSSVGELFWDGACAWAGALFAFHVTRSAAGFRWGMAAAALTLAMFTAGPGWYLFGRGLSELTSAGLVYAAALLVLRGRRSPRFVVLAGLCLAIAFYTRLNNLFFALAVAGFALPVGQAAGDWHRWRQWWPRCSTRALAGVVGALALAVLLFSLRTYYYTGHFNALSGTQASARSVWQVPDGGGTIADNVIGSVAVVLSMSDPPHFDPRAMPIVFGSACALLGLAGVGRFARLPLNVSLLCLAGLAGALVARGSAYPGRFSMHLIPVTVALTVCTAALWSRTKARP